jgi:hypothetical protein
MWLQILQSCKHERDAFFAGEIRYVSGASADVLIAMGWARAVAERPMPRASARSIPRPSPCKFTPARSASLTP